MNADSTELPEGLTRDQIRRYLGRRDSDLRAIRGAFQTRNAREIRDITHKLKGNAALYGLEEFGLAAGRLSADADREDWGSMERSLTEFEEALRNGKAKYA